jgi:hypothetical protein
MNQKIYTLTKAESVKELVGGGATGLAVGGSVGGGVTGLAVGGSVGGGAKLNESGLIATGDDDNECFIKRKHQHNRKQCFRFIEESHYRRCVPKMNKLTKAGSVNELVGGGATGLAVGDSVGGGATGLAVGDSVGGGVTALVVGDSVGGGGLVVGV